MDVEVPKPEEIIATATPSKYIIEEITLKLRCFVHYVDYEGRSDAESIKNIIQQLSPRKLVFLALTVDDCTWVEGSNFAIT